MDELPDLTVLLGDEVRIAAAIFVEKMQMLVALNGEPFRVCPIADGLGVICPVPGTRVLLELDQDRLGRGELEDQLLEGRLVVPKVREKRLSFFSFRHV